MKVIHLQRPAQTRTTPTGALRALYGLWLIRLWRIAVFPKAGNIHFAEPPKPDVHHIPSKRKVLVRVLGMGIDSTDEAWEAGTRFY